MAAQYRECRRLTPANLRRHVHECSERARARGALIPFETETRAIDDGGMRFVVRVSSTVTRKAEAAYRQRRGTAPEDPFTPPYEPDLLVGDLSDTHVALLNKFNVLDDHLLLVTRAHEDQEDLLGHADFEALLLGLAGIDGLAFYNGGHDAGASQAHKHLQIVPLPLGPGSPDLPIEPLLRETVMEGEAGRMPRVPFAHAVAPVPPRWIRRPADCAGEAQSVYHALWRRLGYESGGIHQPVPYNLLVTRQWMWLVPRRCDSADGLAVNALGFAGAMLVRDEAGFARLTRLSPMHLLATTGLPAGDSDPP